MSSCNIYAEPSRLQLKVFLRCLLSRTSCDVLNNKKRFKMFHKNCRLSQDRFPCKLKGKEKVPPVFSYGLKIFAYHLSLALLRTMKIFIVNEHDSSIMNEKHFRVGGWWWFPWSGCFLLEIYIFWFFAVRKLSGKPICVREHSQVTFNRFRMLMQCNIVLGKFEVLRETVRKIRLRRVASFARLR